MPAYVTIVRDVDNSRGLLKFSLKPTRSETALDPGYLSFEKGIHKHDSS